MGNPKSQTARIVAVSLLAGAIAWLLPHLNWVLTPSIRYTLLWIEGGQGAKGDYVAVPVQSPLVNRGHPERFTKRVGCVSGEILKFERGDHFCNGEWLDRVLPVASDGRPLQPLQWNGPVPPGKVFLVGDDPRSFDSRYLGFFDRSQTVLLKGLF
jgi:conjugal transfer pilin signal peptidase TrbI